MQTEEIAAGVVRSLKAALDTRVGPLEAAVSDLSAKLAALPVPKDGAQGVDGKDGAPGIHGKDGIDGKDGKDGRDGKDAEPFVLDLVDLADSIKRDADFIADCKGAAGENGQRGERGERGEPGKDGRDGRDGKDGTDGKDGRDGVNGEDGLHGKDGADGRDGKDGVGIERVEVEADGRGFDLVLTDGTRAAIPLQKGADGVNGRDGKDGRDGLNGKDGADGRDGKDGANGVDGKDGAAGLNGKDGRDGIDGKNGADGLNGKDADPAEMLAAVERMVRSVAPELLVKLLAAAVPDIAQRTAALVPRGVDGVDGRDGRDGAPGQDGADGLGFDDLRVEYDGERSVEIVVEREGRRKSFPLRMPIPIYRGVFESGRGYEQSDTVTYGGSTWIALTDTKQAPGTADWRMQVKRGKDGKDGA